MWFKLGERSSKYNYLLSCSPRQGFGKPAFWNDGREVVHYPSWLFGYRSWKFSRMMHAAGLGPNWSTSLFNRSAAYRWYTADLEELLIDWLASWLCFCAGSEVNFVHQPSLEKEIECRVKRRNNIFLHFDNEMHKCCPKYDTVSVWH